MQDTTRQTFLAIDRLQRESQGRLRLMRWIVAAVCAAVLAVVGTILAAALGRSLSIGRGLHTISEAAKRPVEITLGPNAEKQFDEFRKVAWMYEAPVACTNGRFGDARQVLDRVEHHWSDWNSEYRAAYLFLRVVAFVELLKSESDPDTIRVLRDEIELVSTTLLAFLISMDDESKGGLKWNTELALELHVARRYAGDYPDALPPNFEKLVQR